MLVAAAVALLCGHCLVAHAAADRWQMLMTSADQAVKNGDDDAAAFLLEHALRIARTDDPMGPRPTLTRLALIVAHVELGNKTRVEQLNKERLRIDVGGLERDGRLKSYIRTLNSMGWGYMRRFRATPVDASNEDKQATRLRAAEYCFMIEVALRNKLMPFDANGRGEAHASLAYVLSREKKFEQAQKEFEAAIDDLTLVGKRVANAAGVDNVLAGPTRMQKTVSEEFDAGGMELTVATMSAQTLIINSSQEATIFDSNAKSVEQRLLALSNRLTVLDRVWPNNLATARLAMALAWTYEAQLRSKEPGHFPEALANAKARYEQALVIFEKCEGVDSPDTRGVADQYRAMLRNAGNEREAQAVEQKYRLTKG